MKKTIVVFLFLSKNIVFVWVCVYPNYLKESSLSPVAIETFWTATSNLLDGCKTIKD